MRKHRVRLRRRKRRMFERKKRRILDKVSQLKRGEFLRKHRGCKIEKKKEENV